MTMTGVERRWLSIVLSSFLDPTAPGFALDRGEVDFVAGATKMYDASSPLARVGMRLSLLAAMLSPLFILGRLAPLSALPASERAMVLSRFSSHRVFLLRGMGILLKLAASMAMFRVGTARARTNHERRDLAANPRRFALPLLRPTVAVAA